MKSQALGSGKVKYIIVMLGFIRLVMEQRHDGRCRGGGIERSGVLGDVMVDREARQCLWGFLYPCYRPKIPWPNGERITGPGKVPMVPQGMSKGNRSIDKRRPNRECERLGGTQI